MKFLHPAKWRNFYKLQLNKFFFFYFLWCVQMNIHFKKKFNCLKFSWIFHIKKSLTQSNESFTNYRQLMILPLIPPTLLNWGSGELKPKFLSYLNVSDVLYLPCNHSIVNACLSKSQKHVRTPFICPYASV